MLIAIDESGDFNPLSDKFNYFVATLLKASNEDINKKKGQFENWEKSIPNEDNSRNEKGEIKGNNIKEHFYESFAKEVILSDPKISIAVIRIKPNENEIATIEKFKEIEVNAISEIKERIAKLGNKNLSEDYNKIYSWYKNRTNSEFLKLKSLNSCIGLALNHAIGWIQVEYALGKSLDNLNGLKIKVDKDFIKGDNTKLFWNEIMRQFWMDFTKNNPVPIVPFKDQTQNPLNSFFKLTENEILIEGGLTSLIEFVTSHDNFEVRIADITSNIIQKFQNLRKAEVAYKLIEPIFNKGYLSKHYRLNKQV